MSGPRTGMRWQSRRARILLTSLALLISLSIVLLLSWAVDAVGRSGVDTKSWPEVDTAPAQLDRDLADHGPRMDRARVPVEGPPEGSVSDRSRVSLIADQAIEGLPAPEFELVASDAPTIRFTAVLDDPVELPVGRYSVRTTGVHRLARPCEFEVVSGEEQVVRIMLAQPFETMWCVVVDENDHPVSGLQIGLSKSDAEGRIAFCRYEPRSGGSFRIEAEDPLVELNPGFLRWGRNDTRIEARRTPQISVEVFPAGLADSCFLFPIRYDTAGSRGLPRWIPIGELLLKSTKDLHAVALRGPHGIFGPFEVPDGLTAKITVPPFVRAVFRSSESAFPDDQLELAYDVSGRLPSDAPIISWTDLPGYGFASWLSSKTVRWADASSGMSVQRDCAFLVTIRKVDRHFIYGPLRVHTDGQVVTLGSPRLEVPATLGINVLVDEPLDLKLRLVVQGAEKGDAPKAMVLGSGVVNLPMPSSDAFQVTVQRQWDEGSWSACYEQRFQRPSVNDGPVVLDLRGRLPLRVRGVLVLEGDIPVDLADKKVVFLPADPVGIRVVGGIQFSGDRVPLEGPGVATPNLRGNFELLSEPGAYWVNVVDTYGDDIGFAPGKVVVHPGEAALTVVSQPREIVFPADNWREIRSLRVVGPRGAVELQTAENGSLRVVPALEGQYRIHWTEAGASRDRTLDVRKQDIVVSVTPTGK